MNDDDTVVGNYAMTILLGSAQAIVVSDANGFASWTPPGQAQRDFEVEGSASVASGSSVSFEMEVIGRASQSTQRGSGAVSAGLQGVSTAAVAGETRSSNTSDSLGAWQLSPEVPEDCKRGKDDKVEKRNAAGAQIPAQKDREGCQIQP